MNRSLLPLLVASVLLACGDDDGASVRDLGATGSDGAASVAESGSASGSASAAGSGSGSASAPGDGPAPCTPVNADLEPDAARVLEMTLTDFRFDRTEYTVESGITTFAVTNAGAVDHEVAFLPGGGDVPMDGGVPDEAALAAAGAFELEAFGAGLTCTATFDLEPGVYTLFCIVPIDDERTHYDVGMRATLTVT